MPHLYKNAQVTKKGTIMCSTEKGVHRIWCDEERALSRVPAHRWMVCAALFGEHDYNSYQCSLSRISGSLLFRHIAGSHILISLDPSVIITMSKDSLPKHDEHVAQARHESLLF